MGVSVYVELKRENSVFGMYPLCVSITDNDVEEIAIGECVFREDVLQLGYNDNLEDMDVYDSNELNPSNCGKAYTQDEFDKLMEKIENIDIQVEASTEYVYMVNDGPRRFIIDLKKKTCSCRMFQMDEIPCSHAWAVLKSKNLTADAYCSDLFKPSTVVNTYDVPIDPLPDERE
ncbi:uncharacterized protein LOC132047775 [Lycium ferocissimum]|uniref:uncharacterized protein LOC132047775 n=1 Tax=Lycium ferocissimum TaxID=112874 RepID=UPI0028165E12|nr:uncharacterized protein LOC132047775 [Lycium ferocissimum]